VKSAATYAEMLHITPRHLNRLVSESIGKTTTRLIGERVVLEAKRILFYSDDTIARISEELGFNDPAYFSRLFKKYTGLSPYEFAKRYRARNHHH